jgi:ABC-type antimicrobial peptide transport system permease subunit
MRALRERMSGITRMVTVENVIVAMAGLVVGSPLAVAALWAFLRLYSSDLFSMPFWLSGRTVVSTVLGVTLVLVLAQWPALRQIQADDIAEVAKSGGE